MGSYASQNTNALKLPQKIGSKKTKTEAISPKKQIKAKRVLKKGESMN